MPNNGKLKHYQLLSETESSFPLETALACVLHFVEGCVKAAPALCPGLAL